MTAIPPSLPFTWTAHSDPCVTNPNSKSWFDASDFPTKSLSVHNQEVFLPRIRSILKSREHRLACLVALAADAVQIVLLPLFVEGAVSPVDWLVDLIVAGVLSRLIGWHWAFLPSFAAELIPGVDLFPTWTLAVLYVTQRRGYRGSADVEVLPPDAPFPPARPTFPNL